MYTGHLVVAHSAWLHHASSDSASAAYCLAEVISECATGDPVFILDARDQNEEVRFHTGVRGTMVANAADMLARWGKQIGATDVADLCRLFPTLQPLRRESTIQAWMLAGRVPIVPPLRLRSLGIAMPANGIYRECDADEVLAILAALPPQARTSWTVRVVERNNDIEV